MQRFCILHHYFCTLILTFYSSWHTKKSKEKRCSQYKESCRISAFPNWLGFKTTWRRERRSISSISKVEVDFISELNLTQDILAIKSLVDGVKQNLQIEPTPESGDFTHSVVALALGIAPISHLSNISLPESWRDQIEKKLLTIYYPEKLRNKVVDWAKANGYSTSSYLDVQSWNSSSCT